MGRLIDADALIEFIDAGHLRHPSELCFSELDVVNMLNHAPTAFDIEMVLADLEEYKNWYSTHGCNEDLNRGIIGATNHAIDIVKAGGVK